MNEFLKQFRAQYPGAYDDMSDADLMRAIYNKFYSDMPFESFVSKVSKKYPSSENVAPAKEWTSYLSGDPEGQGNRAYSPESARQEAA